MSQKSCEEYAAGVKRAAGWTFCHLFNFYFGNSTIVLAGEGPGGTDVEFSATEQWLADNHAANFGLDQTMAQNFAAHVQFCQSAECVEANKRLVSISFFFAEGKLPGGEAIAIVSACEGKGHWDKTVLARSNGFGTVIDEIHPFIKWFTEDRDFWVWSD